MDSEPSAQGTVRAPASEVPRGVNETMPVKHFAQCLAHKKYRADDSYYYSQEVFTVEAIIQERKRVRVRDAQQRLFLNPSEHST